jgi:hypothetical protein
MVKKSKSVKPKIKEAQVAVPEPKQQPLPSARVVRNIHANIAIEIISTATQAVMVHRMNGTPELERFVFATPGQRREYETDWQQAFGKDGQPYDPAYVARRFIKGDLQKPFIINTQVIEALAEVFPKGDHHVFTGIGFVGRFDSSEDARLLGSSTEPPLCTFNSAASLKALSHQQLQTVCDQLEMAIPAKPTKVFFEGVFQMARKASSKKATKVAKVEGAKRRADGPVSKLRDMFGKLDLADPEATTKVLAKAEELGINKGTALTQLSRARKNAGIQMRGSKGAAPKKIATRSRRSASTSSQVAA